MSLTDSIAQLDALVDRSRVESVRRLLGQVLPQHPEAAELKAYAGWLARAEDDYEQAKLTLEEVLTDPPADTQTEIWVRLMLADVYEHLESYPDAEVQYIELLERFPGAPDIWAGYADLIFHASLFDKARLLVNEALRLDPANANALRIDLFLSHILAPAAETQEKLVKLYRVNPDDLGAILALIRSLRSRAQLGAAFELARELAMLFPSNEPIVELAEELQMEAHWSLKLRWPLHRFGYISMLALSVVAVYSTKYFAAESVQYAAITIVGGYWMYAMAWPEMLRDLLD